MSNGRTKSCTSAMLERTGAPLLVSSISDLHHRKPSGTSDEVTELLGRLALRWPTQLNQRPDGVTCQWHKKPRSVSSNEVQVRKHKKPHRARSSHFGRMTIAHRLRWVLQHLKTPHGTWSGCQAGAKRPGIMPVGLPFF